jgi:uncharacterized iron-regulated protein
VRVLSMAMVLGTPLCIRMTMAVAKKQSLDDVSEKQVGAQVGIRTKRKRPSFEQTIEQRHR